MVRRPFETLSYLQYASRFEANHSEATKQYEKVKTKAQRNFMHCLDRKVYAYNVMMAIDFRPLKLERVSRWIGSVTRSRSSGGGAMVKLLVKESRRRVGLVQSLGAQLLHKVGFDDVHSMVVSWPRSIHEAGVAAGKPLR